ncbi:MAG TPA: radical SAM protein [Bacteroidales bacterium]|nr:radical SAM protein [Bacteroidales bacterium]
MPEISAFNSTLYKNNYKKLFVNLLRFNSTSLTNILFLIKVVWFQFRALKTRKKSKNLGIEVPPLIFFSITKNCNLNCKGCYQKAQNRAGDKDMSTEKIISILQEGQALGSSVIGVLGGEPFTRKDFFTITGSFKKMLFATFTNGMLIDEAMIAKLRKNKNIIPIISNEGPECETDNRRGAGVYSHFRSIAKKFKANHIIFGVSFTVTSKNFGMLTDETFIKELISDGSSLFFYVNYKPVDGISQELSLNKDQLKVLEDYTYTFREKYKTLYFSPLAEKQFGGCIGAGKGLIHINFDGGIEPCPFAPYSDVNLNNVSLKEALNSKLLRTIRDQHAWLEQNNNCGCSLWENRDWLKSLTKEKEPVSEEIAEEIASAV